MRFIPETFVASAKFKLRLSFARNFDFCLSVFSFTLTEAKPLVPEVQVRKCVLAKCCLGFLTSFGNQSLG